MKKIITIAILLLFVMELGFSQGLTNWKHYYATPYNGFDIGNSIASGVQGEVILLDKSTLSITRIPFPADIRALNPHLNLYTGNFLFGPGHNLILSGGPSVNTYQFDGMNFQPITSYQGFNINTITFFPNTGGSTFFTANNNGLYKWDGSTLTTYDSTNSPFHYNQGWYNKYTTPNDDIFLTSPYLIAIYHNGIWTNYDTTFFNNHGITTYTKCVSPMSDFTFYDQYDTLIHTFKNATSSWSSFHIPSSVKHSVNSYLSSLIYDANGDLWLSGDSIFCKYDGTNFYDYYSYLTSGATSDIIIQNNLSANKFLIISYDNNNGSKQYIFDANALSYSPLNDPQAILPQDPLYLALKDNAGNLWFSTDGLTQQIIKYNGTWKTIRLDQYFTTLNSMVNDTGTAIVLGGETMGLTNGIMQLNDTTFTFLDTGNTNSNNVGGVVIDNNHHYWAIDGSNLEDLHNGVVTNHYSPSSFEAYSLGIDSLGNKWTDGDTTFSSMTGNGVYKFNGTWTHFKTSNSPLPDDSIIQINREGSSNKMWFSTRNGFARYWNGHWLIYNTNNSPLPSNHAENVYLDNDSTLWFSTMEGFASLKAGVWNVYSPMNSPCHNSDIENIVVDNNCTLWAATAGGLTSARLPCGQAQGMNVTGYVNKSNGTPAPNTMVYVYKLNSSGTDVTQVDNVFTDNLGVFTYYTTDTGKYYFEANVSSSQFAENITAYEDSALVVQQSIPLHLTTNGTYTANIKLRQTNSATAGWCVLKGKLESSTERIGSVRLVLMFNNQPVESVLSGVDGRFQFTGLSPGNYSVWVDKLGLNNTSAPLINVDCANNWTEHLFDLYPSYLTLNTPSLSMDNTITVYPNPNKGIFTIASSSDKLKSISIVNILGEQVYSIEGKQLLNGKEISIELNNVAKGIYFVRITDENKNVVNRKIVVQ